MKRSALGAVLALITAFVLLTACGGDDEPQSISPAQQDQAQQQEQQTSATAVSAGAQAETEPQQTVTAQEQAQAAQSSVQQQQSAAPEPEQQAQAAAESAQEASAQQSAEPAQEPAQQQQTAQAQTQVQQTQASAEQTGGETVPEGTRLISLFGDLTEIVYALGAQEFLVGRDTSSVYPADTDALPNLGFAGALNVEAILALEPTLVIGNSMAGPPGVLEQLEAAGVDLLIIETPTGLDAPGIKIRAIGEALHLSQTAETLARDVEARMAAVQAQAQTIENPPRVLLVYIRRGGLQLVSGEGNEAQTIIEAAGGIDAGAEAGIVGWQALTPEALVAANPDVYLVMELGLEVIGGIDKLLAIPGMAETTAGRERRIIAMSDLYLLGFGPRLPEAVAELSAYLQALQEE